MAAQLLALCWVANFILEQLSSCPYRRIIGRASDPFLMANCGDI